MTPQATIKARLQINPFFLKLQAMLSEVTGVDPEDLSPGMEFDELSMSPVELSEFFAHVKSQFAFPISIKDLEDNPTIGELAEYIEDETA